MYRTRIRPLCVLLLMTIYCALEAIPLHAQFETPTNVKVGMYRLNFGSGSIAIDPGTGDPVPCTKGDTSYGCTADEDNTSRAYPFISSTITISIDGVDGPDNTVYGYPYLWDVAPQELDMDGSQGNKPPAAVKAQLIAARTYIYQRMTYINQYGTPNNSTQFQVFLPYRYAALSSAQQNRVMTEATDRFYLSEANNAYPIEALYGADNPAQTIAGNRPYLTSVADPISAAYGLVDGTGNGGMSSKGASRWSFGHTSSRGAVSPSHPRYPHDEDGNGDFWSVRWYHAPQILTHYYTGVHLRNAASNNALVTPEYRWVPLKMAWSPGGDAPPILCRNHLAVLRVWVQNSGATTWNLDASATDRVSFFYSSMQNPGSPGAQVEASAADQSSVAPGQAVTFTLNLSFPDPGSYELRFDMMVGSQEFSTREAERPWPVYDPLDITILPCVFDQFVHLPIIHTQLAASSAH